MVLVLAYFGLLFFCFGVLPAIEAQYRQVSLPPTGFTEYMVVVRESAAIWGFGFPIVLLIFVLFLRGGLAGALGRLLPGNRASQQCMGAAAQTRRLATLVGAGLPADQAMELTQQAQPSARRIKAVAEDLLQQEDSESSPRALMRLAAFYRYLAMDHRRSFWQGAPAVLGILAAGVVVLGYSLVMFLPWIEVLTGLGGIGGLAGE